MRGVLAGIFCAAAFVSVAWAQEVITRPVWVERPVPNRIPVGRYYPSVILTCHVNDEGRLTECAAETSTPEAYIAPAIEAAGRAVLAVVDAEGQPTNGRTIRFNVGFPLPVAIDPPPAPPGPRLTSPSWLERPTVQNYASAYPAAALAANQNGQANLDCIVAADGRLSCLVLDETPANSGFGVAALRVSRAYRMTPQTPDGQPTAGGRVRIPVQFVAEAVR